MERAKLEIPAATRKALKRVFAETRAAHSVRGKVAVARRLLRDPALAGQKDPATALEFGIELLEDGASTIYSSKHPFYRQIGSPRVEPQGGAGSSWGDDDPPGSGGGTGGGRPNDDVGQADFEGGVEGSFGGYMAGLSVSPPGTESVGGELGAAFGGTAGAIGSSAAAIGRKFVNWLF